MASMRPPSSCRAAPWKSRRPFSAPRSPAFNRPDADDLGSCAPPTAAIDRLTRKSGRREPARKSWGLNLRRTPTGSITLGDLHCDTRVGLCFARQLSQLESPVAELGPDPPQTPGGWGAEESGARGQTGP